MFSFLSLEVPTRLRATHRFTRKWEVYAKASSGTRASQNHRHSPTVICAAITSKMNKAKLPTHIEIDASAYGIEKDSVILLEQLRTIDKRRLKDKVCHLDSVMLDKVNHALEISLELTF